MIDPFFTSMTCIAGLLALSNFYALNGWRKNLRAKRIAQDTAAYERNERANINAAYNQTTELYYKVCAQLNGEVLARDEALDHASRWHAVATDLEDRLRKIEQARHASAKHARAVQLDRQRAAILEKARELRAAPDAAADLQEAA